MLSLRKIAETFNTMVEWDGQTQTANLLKLNVNMIICDDILWPKAPPPNVAIKLGTDTYDFEYPVRNIIVNPWQYLYAGASYDFMCHIEVMGLTPDQEYEERAIIEDFEGNLISVSPGGKFIADETGVTIISCPFRSVPISKEGMYTVKYQLKYNNDYITVGEKDFYAAKIAEETH